MRLKVDSVEAVAEMRMRDKIKTILDCPSHPLWQMGTSFVSLRYRTGSFRSLFVPTVISSGEH